MSKFKLFILYLLIVVAVTAQNNDAQKIPSLEENVNEAAKLFKTNPEKALLNAEELLQLAVANKDYQAELRLLQTLCDYYTHKIDLKNQLRTSQQLLKRAQDIKDEKYQAMAVIYMMNAYSRNGLYEKAEQQYGKAYKLLEKQNPSDTQVIKIKATLYTASASLFYERELIESSIGELKKAIKERSKLPKGYSRDFLLYTDYSNLAGSYVETNIDSAEYYVKQSMALKPKGTDPLFTYRNHSILGAIYLKKQMYSSAVDNFLTADSIGDVFGYTNNKDLLYNDLIQSYKGLGDTRNAEKYENKLLNYKYNMEHGKNQSLKDIIVKEEKDSKQTIKTILYISLLAIVISSLVFWFFLKKKNKEMAKQEEVSQDYLEKLDVLNNEIYNEKNLIEMAVNRDKAFLVTFNKAFPDFSKKILAINPSIVQTELEFMALIRLNLSTKEIAQIQSVIPKTVQEKKRRIRKRLGIPQDMDIYHYFNQLG